MTKPGYIAVSYKCACLKAEVSIDVPARTEFQPISDWMEITLNEAIFTDHSTRSPQCRAKKLDYLKIPISENKPLGSKPTEH